MVLFVHSSLARYSLEFSIPGGCSGCSGSSGCSVGQPPIPTRPPPFLCTAPHTPDSDSEPDPSWSSARNRQGTPSSMCRGGPGLSDEGGSLEPLRGPGGAGGPGRVGDWHAAPKDAWPEDRLPAAWLILLGLPGPAPPRWWWVLARRSGVWRDRSGLRG